MTVGNDEIFAIEHGITCAYERPSFLALGYFNIHVGGVRFGVNEPDATAMANSVEEVSERIQRRGTHTAPFIAEDASAAQIADSINHVIYAPDQEHRIFFGLSHRKFLDAIYRQHLIWAPDGDEAFDDGSTVIHIDVDDRVRLVAFRTIGYDHDPKTLRELWISSDSFYKVLSNWRDAFQRDYNEYPKHPNGFFHPSTFKIKTDV